MFCRPNCVRALENYNMLIIIARIPLLELPRTVLGLLIYQIKNAARIELSKSNKMLHTLYQL